MNREQAFLDKYRLARAQRGVEPLAELGHLERAHILGQPHFVDHLRSHLWLLAWAWRQGDWAELAAQLLRLPGTRRVGPLTVQPLPVDLRRRLE